jgi:RNA helicase armi
VQFEEGFPSLSKFKIIKYKIIISTLSNLGPLMHIRFKREHFTHVIIDEAGQSVETETMIPLSFLDNRGQVVLAGDPKQLSPIITSQVAKICGFEKSLLERLSEHKFYQPTYGPNNDEFDCKFVTKLKTNYRALPSILKVYSKLFYNDELEPAINDTDSRELVLLNSVESILWSRSTADKKCGIYFVNVVDGKNMRMPGSTSLFNNQEASRLFLFVCRLKRLGIPMKSVGIVSEILFSMQTCAQTCLF